MYYILHKDSILLGVSPFVEATQQGLPGVSFEIVDGTIPDMNYVIWNTTTLRLVNTKITLRPVDFLSRFTLQERITIAGSTDPVVKDIMNLLDAAPEISLDDGRTLQAVGYLQAVGILTTIRGQEILSA